MNPFEMVVLIVAIVMMASVIKARRRHDRSHRHDEPLTTDQDALRMREEIKLLKDRVAVLERLATDTNGAVALDREIEKLRQG